MSSLRFSDLLRKSSFAFFLRGIGACLTFSLSIAIGRLLGAEGAGLYFLGISAITLVSVITKFGLDNALLRFVSLGASSGDWFSVLGVYRLGMAIAIVSSTIAMGLVFTFASWLADNVVAEPAFASMLRAFSPAVLALTVVALLAESLKGLQRVGGSMLVSGLICPGVALCVIWPMVEVFGAPGAAISYAVGAGFAAAAGWSLWIKSVAKFRTTTPYFDRQRLWHSCFPLWIMSIVNRGILPLAPILLLGTWGSASDAGVFGAATRLAMLVTFFLTAVNTVIAPRFAELHARGEIVRLRNLASFSAVFVTLAASPLILGLIFAGDWLLGLFGPDFRAGSHALIVLAIGQAVSVVSGSAVYLLMMTGHEADARNGAIVSMVVMLVCAALLIPKYGLLGAAVTSAVSTATLNIFSGSMVYVRLRIILFAFYRETR